MEIVATTSLPAVDRKNANRWNAARSCQKLGGGEEKLNLLYNIKCISNLWIFLRQKRMLGVANTSLYLVTLITWFHQQAWLNLYLHPCK